ncbi:MAG: T9SS type A sorting domain-containing protein, partial [Saprospiraceae bacterium]|nr:T9SS type A sorting domain-containing protein [Saprospiraceae bacterium]
DNRVQITGGQLGLLNGYYYLVGGQKFEGRYNPMGPDHGPGFIQQYSNAIRKFKIQQTKDNLSISDYTETIDTAELHRRDYNMMPQIFPDGSKGFTVFSGVFQYKADLPWLNTIDISPNGYKVIPEFEQRFNQYHCAKTALYDPTNNISYNIFYGGISRFYLTQDGNLVDDLDVPFVKSISLITRDQNGNLNESSIGNMPDFLGASAEFIPDQNLSKFSDTEILTFNPNNPDSILIGYIFGGIKSSSDKVFWINTGTQSEASNQIYKVYLHQKATSIRKLTSESLNYFKPIVYPNPAFDHFVVEFNLQKSEMIKIDLTDLNGKLMTQKKQKCTDGLQKIEVPMTDLPDGNYIVTISNGKLKHSLKIMK